MDERAVQDVLEACLGTGESLLAFTTGEIKSGIPFTQFQSATPYHVGLTSQRLLLLPPGSTSPPISIGREWLKALKYGRALSVWLQIELPRDTFTLSLTGGNWQKRAREMATAAATDVVRPIRLTVARPELLKQAQGLETLGFIASAREVLNQAMTDDPAMALDEGVEAVRRQLANTHLAARMGAGFLFVEFGVLLLLAGLLGSVGLNPWQNVGFWTFAYYAASVVIGIHLWGGRSDWRAYAILLAAFGFFGNVVTALAGGNWLTLLSGAGLSGAVMLALVGRSPRWRMAAAVGVFVVGYLGVTLFSSAWFIMQLWPRSIVALQVDYPATVRVGERFDIVVHLQNTSQAEVMVGDIDLSAGFEGDHSILEGAIIQSTEPNLQSEEWPDLNLLSYKYYRSLQPGESQTVIFHARANQAGEYHTSIDAYIDDLPLPASLLDFGVNIIP